MDALLAQLNKLGIRVRANGDSLDVTAPKGTLTAELRAAIATNKEGLIVALNEFAATAPMESSPWPSFDESAQCDCTVPTETLPASYETLETSLDLSYAWAYGDTRQKLRDLYNKAKREQWLPETVLPWETEVDPMQPLGPDGMNPLWGSDIWTRMTPAERRQCDYEVTAWTISNFLHGEQGALLAAAQLVDSVTDLDSKLCGATQVVDEARHVEVFNRYLQEKVCQTYPVNPNLKSLLDLLLTDSRWDMKFLGMQVMVEGLALSSLATLRDTARDPLLRQITAYVMGDEARHMAYGIVSLSEYYEQQSESLLREREDFVFEGARLMRNRFLLREVWEKLGLPVQECMNITLHAPFQVMYRQRLFAKIVPTVKRIGLLSNRQRQRFAALGILRFEDIRDPYPYST